MDVLIISYYDCGCNATLKVFNGSELLDVDEELDYDVESQLEWYVMKGHFETYDEYSIKAAETAAGLMKKYKKIILCVDGACTMLEYKGDETDE